MSSQQENFETVGGGYTMDKVKKILSSPISRRKNNSNMASTSSDKQTTPAQRVAPPKYFGVSLETVVVKEGNDIPRVVTKVCSYILDKGLTSEGIFRVNGNAKITERLKASFENSGDANLDTVSDVFSVAGLLKLYLRELPLGVITEENTRRFVQAQQDFNHVREASNTQLRILLRQLAATSYSLLKYLCYFLVRVSLREAENKMSPQALGIVFGPNIFRCTLGLQGLKDQGITNHVMRTFIQDYDMLFLADGEISPFQQNGKKRRAPAPPTPVVHPVVSPRKHKTRHEGSFDLDEESSVRSSDTHPSMHNYSDDDLLSNGRLSPFPLETDRSEYSGLATILSINGEVVDKVISSAISEHLFGDSFNPTSEDDTSRDSTPIAPPRRKRNQALPHKIQIDDDSTSSNESDNEMKLTVKQRIQQMEQGEQQTPQGLNNGSKPQKQRPVSKAFELFEKKGIVIGPAPENLMKTLHYAGDGAEVPVESDENESANENDVVPNKPVPKPRHHVRKADDSQESDESGLNSITREEDTLTSFKKPAGPKNRRTPTRRSMKGPDSLTEDAALSTLGDDENENPKAQNSYEQRQTRPLPYLPAELSHPTTKPLHLHIPTTQHNPTYTHPRASTTSQFSTDAVHGSQLSPSMKFLDLPYNGTQGSPEKSPAEQRKPYVPPLDLSILHEHGDGSDPIAVDYGQSVSLHKVQPTQTDTQAMVSPRSDKMHGQKSGFADTDLPPSPPMETQLRLQRVDEDYAVQIKQYTKKIQSCKRRIKQFEENFEAQYGYRPSQTDKAAKPDIKKCMQDLSKARKELKRIKEEQEQQRGPETGGGDSSEKTAAGSPSMRDSLHALMKRLDEKRREGNRPEDISLMSWEQVQEEKLAVQKTLLHFESIHGRPSTKAEKELMRPLYDRYRNVKRMLAKGVPASTNQADLLQTVPEDTAIDFDTGSAITTVTNREPIRVPTAEPEEDEQHTFMVTKDMRLLRDTMLPGDTQPMKSMTGGWVDETMKENIDTSPERTNIKNLHEMTVSQLLEEQNRVREEKKRLRKVLREFEDEFLEVNGRKVQKEDRSPMNNEYQEYKQVKARLKLMEALLSKHDSSPDL